MRYNKVTIQNFKGIKAFTVQLDGSDAVITAENGVGKTSIKDGVSWLCFDKDSTNRKDFDFRPLDEDNQLLPGLETLVEVELELDDGAKHVLTKINTEKFVKKISTGFTNTYFIDEVPVLLKDFKAWINDNITPEELFRLLSDVKYFAGDLHWNDRRTALLDLASKISIPAGFESLVEAMNGREVGDYKKVLLDRMKPLIEKQKGIGPRIDEIQQGHKDYVKADTSEFEAKRNALKNAKTGMEEHRKDITAKEASRQANVDCVNALKLDKSRREVALANDTSSIQTHVDAKAKIVENVAAAKLNVTEVKNAISAHESVVKTEQANLESAQARRDNIFKEYKELKEAQDDQNCYACGQVLPAEKVTGLAEKKGLKLAEIEGRGLKAKAEIDKIQETIDTLNEETTAFKETLDKAEILLTEAEAYRDEQMPIIDKAIETRQTVKPEDDENWKSIVKKIEKFTKEIGEPVTEQLAEIDKQLEMANEDLIEINKTLAQADRMTQDTARIAELGEQEKGLAQQIADIEMELAQIGEYMKAESEAVELAVNDKFELVTFKMFDRQINGEIKPTCMAMLHGTPFPELSTGEKILAGVDIIKTLNKHYDLSIPLFIDNAESVTLQIVADCQMIELLAKKSWIEKVVTPEGIKEIYHDYTKLNVTVEKERVAA